MAYDEMWTYRGVRRGEKRESWWIWTAVVQEPDGRRWVDFEVGDRSAAPFLRWYARLPEAQQYCSDFALLPVRSVDAEWLPPAQHQVGKGGPVNWNEGTLIYRSVGVAAEQAEPADAADEGVHQKH